MQYVSWNWKDQAEEKGIMYSNSEMLTAINEFIHSARDREIIKLRLIDGYTYAEIAETVHLSERQIKRIVYKAQERLLKVT